jgi:hypothetical protein
MLRSKRRFGRSKQPRTMLLPLLASLIVVFCVTPRASLVQAQTGAQTLSRSGCVCLPTLVADTSTSVTCYHKTATDPLGCAVDPSDVCADGGVSDRTWDLCNGRACAHFLLSSFL